MHENAIKARTVHYGWYVVAAGTLCIFASLGFGRFALGMLLPAMAESLNLTYSHMGSSCLYSIFRHDEILKYL